MARIRTIKPEFWRDEQLSSVSAEAALLAIGLLNHADDEGYFNANPKLVEADVFPLRELSRTCTVLMDDLAGIGYIAIFEASDGKRYGQVINFSKHQVINKPKPSNIKALCTVPYQSGSNHVPVQPGMEGNGTGKGKSKTAHAGAACAALFDMFWKEYPKKQDKKRALEAFKRLKPTLDLVHMMIEAIHAQTKWRQAKTTANEFVPEWQYPQGWLNGHRWEDDLTIPVDSQAYVDPVSDRLRELFDAQERGCALFNGSRQIKYLAGLFVRADDESKSVRASDFLRDKGIDAVRIVEPGSEA